MMLLRQYFIDEWNDAHVPPGGIIATASPALGTSVVASTLSCLGTYVNRVSAVI